MTDESDPPRTRSGHTDVAAAARLATDTVPDLAAHPYVAALDDATTAAHAAEWSHALAIAADTETAYEPTQDINRDGPGAWRVLSVWAAYDQATLDAGAIGGEGLVTGAHLPAWLPDAVAGAKAYVVDVGHVAPATLAPAMAPLELDAWNADFERRVFARDGVVPARLWDLMLHQAVRDQGAVGAKNAYTGLSQAAETWLGISIEGKGGVQLSYDTVDTLPELSDEQLRYAAHDAVVTGWLGALLRAAGAEQGLTATDEIESRAQPFLAAMQRRGMPLVVDDGDHHEPVVTDDGTFTGWRDYLAHRDRRRRESLSRLAELTHGGDHGAQGVLDFTGGAGEAMWEPDFNPGSNVQLRRVLNEQCPELVKRYTSEVLGWRDGKPGKARLLEEGDTVDKDALKLIGGELADEVREWAKHNKLLEVNGEDMLALRWDDGRLHPRYKQALVETGRLAGSDPNPQNLPPEIKRFVRPAHGWVFAYADLGQAELRYLAQITGDENLLGAFLRGDDIHATTASLMFQLDIDQMRSAVDDHAVGTLDADALAALARANRVATTAVDDVKAAGAEELAQLAADVKAAGDGARKKGKILNFGIAYGLRGRSLATMLTLAGVPTTPEEADELIELYLAAYPKVAAWLAERDAFIEALAADPPEVDFAATWLLVDQHQQVTDAKFAFKRREGHFPAPEQLAEELTPRYRVEAELADRLGRAPTSDELADEHAARVATVRWVGSFRQPVVIGSGGEAFAFESRTLGGRRRLFQVAATGKGSWMTSMAVTAATSRKPRPTEVRAEFERAHSVALSRTGSDGQPQPLTRAAAQRVFGNKELAAKFVGHVLARMPEATGWLQRAALSDQIRAKGNQYRNAPIQGGVADAMERVYALLAERLPAYPGAAPIQTVHDSITVECRAEHAHDVRAVLEQAMVEGLAYYTPDVPASADAVLLKSLDEDEPVSDDEIAAMAAEALAEPAAA